MAICNQKSVGPPPNVVAQKFGSNSLISFKHFHNSSRLSHCCSLKNRPQILFVKLTNAYRGCKSLSSSMNLDSLAFSSYSSRSSRCRSASESVWRTNAVYWGCSDSSHFYASSVIIWHRRSRNVKAAIPPTIITLNSITKTTLLPNRVQTNFLHLIFILVWCIVEVLKKHFNYLFWAFWYRKICLFKRHFWNHDF